MSEYTYKSKRPIEYAEEFIDNFLAHNPIDKFEKDGIPNYIKGVFMFGMDKIYSQNRNEKYGEFISQWLEKCLDEDKKLNRVEGHFWVSLDSLDFRQVGLVLIRQYEETGDKRYLDSIGELCETLFTSYPSTNNDILWHNKQTAPYQVWVDGLYMAGPICAAYAKLSGKKEFGAHAIRQAVLMYQCLRDAKDDLMFHGWDESKEAEWADKETGLSAEKWGRALGWFVVATTDILGYLGDDFEGMDELKEIMKRVFEALLKVQRDEDGYWTQVIDKPNAEGNWRESSCTCLIAYAFAKAYRLGLGDERYWSASKKAFEGVADSIYIDEDGNATLAEVCIGTCIDEGDYNHYINREKCKNDLHGTGAFLQMCAEVNLVK